jgi:hypothetical protein
MNVGKDDKSSYSPQTGDGRINYVTAENTYRLLEEGIEPDERMDAICYKKNTRSRT